MLRITICYSSVHASLTVVHCFLRKAKKKPTNSFCFFVVVVFCVFILFYFSFSPSLSLPLTLIGISIRSILFVFHSADNAFCIVADYWFGWAFTILFFWSFFFVFLLASFCFGFFNSFSPSPSLFLSVSFLFSLFLQNFYIILLSCVHLSND